MMVWVVLSVSANPSWAFRAANSVRKNPIRESKMTAPGGDTGGNKGGDKGGGKEGNKGGDKGGDKEGDKGGEKGGDKGGVDNE